LVVKENGWEVNSCGEQDRRWEELDGDEVLWVTKKLAGDCSEWKMVEEVVFVVIRGDGDWLAMFWQRDSKKLDKRVHELS
jgi:hypothetical protein